MAAMKSLTLILVIFSVMAVKETLSQCHRYVRINATETPKQFVIDDTFKPEDKWIVDDRQSNPWGKYCQFMFMDEEKPTAPFRQFRVVLHGVSLMPDPGCGSSSLTVYTSDDDNFYSTCRDAKDLLAARLSAAGDNVMVSSYSYGLVRAYNLVISVRKDGYWRCGEMSLIPIEGAIGSTTLNATSEEQYLQSPMYPAKVMPNVHCGWTIESGDGNPVEIEIEDAEFSKNCEGCSMTIKDVPDGEIFSVDANNTFPVKFRGTGSGFKVLFRTWKYTLFEPKGFKLKYYTKRFPSSDLTPMTQCREQAELLVADGTIRSLESKDQSPNSRGQCIWKIESNDGNPVEVEITEFNVGADDDYCEKESLQIYNNWSGLNLDASPITTLCGTKKPASVYKYRSAGPEMSIKFESLRSGNSKVKTDFKLKYYTKNTPSTDLTEVSPCRGKVTKLNATAEVQSIEADYIRDNECRWEIHAPLYQNIYFNVTDMNATSGCPMGTLSIEAYQTLQKGCWTSLKDFGYPGKYGDVVYPMRVHYRTPRHDDGQMSGRGFLMSFTTTKPPETDDGGNGSGQIGAWVWGTVAMCLATFLLCRPTLL